MVKKSKDTVTKLLELAVGVVEVGRKEITALAKRISKERNISVTESEKAARALIKDARRHGSKLRNKLTARTEKLLKNIDKKAHKAGARAKGALTRKKKRASK